MITLWGRANSVNVMKVLWLLDELALPFERIEAGGAFGRTRDPDYLAMNPNATVPTLVKDIPDQQALVAALIENIQREDLNPIEVAHAFERLHREFRLSHEQIAQRTGKDRSTVTNMLRLLRLPLEVQQLLAEQRLTMGHARALLGLESAEKQVSLAHKAADGKMSVRQVERTVQKLLTAPPEKPAGGPGIERDPNVRAAIEELERVLGTRVRIVARDENRGRIEIEYYSAEDLDRIYEAIVGR